MKGYSLHDINDLRYEDLNYPECPSGWCVVEVKYVGICTTWGSDPNVVNQAST